MKALFVACHLGNIDIVRCLVKKYNVNVMLEGQPEWDASTNDWRRAYDFCRTVKYPVGKDYSAFWCIDFWGKNALHIACEFGHVNIIDYLMNECKMHINTLNPMNQFTPFHYAVFKNHYEAVQYLVNNGNSTSNVNINLRCSKGSASNNNNTSSQSSTNRMNYWNSSPSNTTGSNNNKSTTLGTSTSNNHNRNNNHNNTNTKRRNINNTNYNNKNKNHNNHICFLH
jgi:ankyrin repeat protein